MALLSLWHFITIYSYLLLCSSGQGVEAFISEMRQGRAEWKQRRCIFGPESGIWPCNQTTGTGCTIPTPAYSLSIPNTTESSYWPCNQTTIPGHAESALLMHQPYPSQHTPLIPNITESSYCAAVASSHSFFQCPCRIFQSAFPRLFLQPSTSEMYFASGSVS